MNGDEVIRLAKGLAVMLQAMADELDVDLSDTTINFRAADESVLATLNAAELVKRANALRYGCIDDEEA